MDSTLPRDARFGPRPGVLIRELDGEAVLLDPDAGRYFGLNATGLRVWALAADGCSVAAIVERLADEYAAPSTAIDAGVGAVLAELEQADLLRRLA